MAFISVPSSVPHDRQGRKERIWWSGPQCGLHMGVIIWKMERHTCGHLQYWLSRARLGKELKDSPWCLKPIVRHESILVQRTRLLPPTTSVQKAGSAHTPPLGLLFSDSTVRRALQVQAYEGFSFHDANERFGLWNRAVTTLQARLLQVATLCEGLDFKLVLP